MSYLRCNIIEAQKRSMWFEMGYHNFDKIFPDVWFDHEILMRCDFKISRWLIYRMLQRYCRVTFSRFYSIVSPIKMPLKWICHIPYITMEWICLNQAHEWSVISRLNREFQNCNNNEIIFFFTIICSRWSLNALGWKRPTLITYAKGQLSLFLS